MGRSNCFVKSPEEKPKYDLGWMDKKIPYIKKGNWLYKFCCFFLGRKKSKLTFKELYLILYGLNKRKIGEDKAKEFALGRILKIYKDLHHNKLPKGIKEDE